MTPNILSNLLRTVGICALSATLAAPALAAPINYGDFDDIPPGVVTYTDVTESSATDDVPLFGPPEAVVNELDFDPGGFGASASGGDIDITDGQLNFSFETLPGTGVRSLVFDEGGDYRFFGGTAATQVSFSLVGQVMITEVDGVVLAPADVIAVPFGAGANFDAAANPTPTQNAPWALGALVEFGLPLSNAGFGPDALVTGADVFLNNTLIAASETGSLAFIAKKDFTVIPGGELDPDNVIPEPTAALLAGLAIVGFVGRRR